METLVGDAVMFLRIQKIYGFLCLLLCYGTIQVYGLNDGKPPQLASFYPLPPPPQYIPTGGEKSWNPGFGGNGYPSSVYPSKPTTNIFPPYPTGGKSWGTPGNVVPVPYPVYIPSGQFGGSGGGKKGLLSGLKTKFKSKFSGLKGVMSGGFGIPAIYMPIGGYGFGSLGGKFGGSSLGDKFGGGSLGGKFGGGSLGGKFGGKFHKGGYPGGSFGGNYPVGSFGATFGDLGVPQTGKSIGGGGYYPVGYPGGITTSQMDSGTTCYDSSQCGMRSCCATTQYGPKCQILSPSMMSRCIDLPARPIRPTFQIQPPGPPTIQILPPRPNFQIVPRPPTIQVLPPGPPNVGGKSWRPPPSIGLPDSDCRPGFCPRFSNNAGPLGPECDADNDCPFPRKCCVVIGSKSGYDRKRICAFPSYAR